MEGEPQELRANGIHRPVQFSDGGLHYLLGLGARGAVVVIFEALPPLQPQNAARRRILEK